MRRFRRPWFFDLDYIIAASLVLIALLSVGLYSHPLLSRLVPGLSAPIDPYALRRRVFDASLFLPHECIALELRLRELHPSVDAFLVAASAAALPQVHAALARVPAAIRSKVQTAEVPVLPDTPASASHAPAAYYHLAREVLGQALDEDIVVLGAVSDIPKREVLTLLRDRGYVPWEENNHVVLSNVRLDLAWYVADFSTRIDAPLAAPSPPLLGLAKNIHAALGNLTHTRSDDVAAAVATSGKREVLVPACGWRVQMFGAAFAADAIDALLRRRDLRGHVVRDSSPDQRLLPRDYTALPRTFWDRSAAADAASYVC